MKRLVLSFASWFIGSFVLFYALLMLSSCSACIEQDELVRLECVPGEKMVCDLAGEDYPNAIVDPIPRLAGQCSYGTKTCTYDGWSECWPVLVIDMPKHVIDKSTGKQITAEIMISQDEECNGPGVILGLHDIKELTNA